MSSHALVDSQHLNSSHKGRNEMHSMFIVDTYLILLFNRVIYMYKLHIYPSIKNNLTFFIIVQQNICLIIFNITINPSPLMIRLAEVLAINVIFLEVCSSI